MIIVVEYPDDIAIGSVVRPAGIQSAEHVFVVTRASEPIGETTSLSEAVEIAWRHRASTSDDGPKCGTALRGEVCRILAWHGHDHRSRPDAPSLRGASVL